MARKKNKGGKKGRGDDDWSDDDDGPTSGPQQKQLPPSNDKKKDGEGGGGGGASVGRGGDNKKNDKDGVTQQQPSRKQKRQAKQQGKQKHHDDDDDDEDDDKLARLLGGALKVDDSDDDDDEDDNDHKGNKRVPPIASANKGNKGRNKGGKGQPSKGGIGKGMAAEDDDDDDDVDVDEDDDALDAARPSKNGGRSKPKGGRAAQLQKKVMFAAKDDDDDDDDDEDEDFDVDEDAEEDDDDDEEVEQITFKILEEPKKDGKKKDKKEKKEKKDKKEKKEKKDKKKSKDKKNEDDGKDDHGDSDDGDEDQVTPEPEKQSETVAAVVASSSSAAATAAATAAGGTSPAQEPKKKSKFELQMEAAMKKKQALDATAVPEETPKKSTKKESVIPSVPDRLAGEDDEEEEPKSAVADHGEHDDLMYGAPDDVVWSDKSHALKEAENLQEEDASKLLYGADGKKLSNKERKRLIKEREAAERAVEYEKVAAKASREGAQFACSQTAVNEDDPQWQNSLDVNIPNFSISAAGKILFKDAALTIGHGRRYGLVGPNGRGKSTLMKMIASRDLKLPPRIDFLYVEQEVVADNTPAVEAVLSADKYRWDLMEEEKALMAKVDNGDESEQVIDRLGVVVEELTACGADSMEAKARRILYGLGFTMEMQTKPTKLFSGGWRMRISLARALFVEPTLLMLDEPTNHLDLNAVLWLDEYLQSWKKTLFVISHDQDFLNSVCQEILNIEDMKLISYKGNYDSFKKAEKERFKQQVKAWEKQEKRLRELKKSGQSKSKAQETVKQNAKRETGARSQKKKNQAIASGSETAENTELITRPKDYTVQIEFSEVAELSRPVMEVNNVSFRYSPKHPVIFEKVDFGIDMDSRICIVGPNGAGKSTLLKLLTGEVEPTTGEVKRNPRLRMGIYNQHFVDRLPMNVSPVEHLRSRFEDLDYQSCRNRLGKYGLEGHAHEVTMRDLSGGQKARVVFVELSLQKPHILLLDEPTNNLDVESIDALLTAIQNFNGGIVVVTHDQRLIEECQCTLWVVEKLGVTEWKAGFDDYKESILRQIEEEVEREANVRKLKLEASAAAKAEKIARLAKKVKK